MDGISQAYKLTSQINNLQKQESLDREAIEYDLAKNFSSLLDNLIAATSYSEEDEKDKKDDPFSFLISSNKTYTNYLLEKQGISLPSSGTGAGTGMNELNMVQNLNLSSDSYLNSLSNFENSSLALLNFQSQLTI